MRPAAAAFTSFLAFALATAPAGGDTYAIDTRHSTIGFSVGIAGGLTAVDGKFTGFEGAVEYGGTPPARSSVWLRIDAASIDTGVNGRDEHLRTEDFFDVEKHPTISFRSDQVQVAGRQVSVTGTLEMRGVKKRIRFDMERKHEAPVVMIGSIPTMVLEGDLSLSRGEFGIRATPRWNQLIEATGELAMSDDVIVRLRVIAEGPRVVKPSGPEKNGAGNAGKSNLGRMDLGDAGNPHLAVAAGDRGCGRVLGLHALGGALVAVAGGGDCRFPCLSPC